MRRFLATLRTVRWPIAALVVAGGSLVAAGGFVHGSHDYMSSAFLDFGAALFLAIPLLLIERLVEGRVATLEQKTQASIENVRQDVEKAHSKIDRLGQATETRIRDAVAGDAATLRALRDDVSEANAWRTLQRARDLSAIDPRGVRVRVPGEALWVRFAARDDDGDAGGGIVRLSVEGEDGEERGASEDWLPDEPADAVFARLIEDVQRARTPGSAHLDAQWIFERLADTLEVALSLRRAGSPVGRVIEVVGDWAITADGVEHLRQEGRTVTRAGLTTEWNRIRPELEADDADGSLAAVLETARAYHSGEDRRAAVRRIPRSE